MDKTTGERGWAFWVLNTSYPNEEQQHFLCVVSKSGIRIESNPAVHIALEDIKRCVPESAALLPFREMVRLELFSQELPISFYVVNPVNHRGYGADGYVPETTSFTDVVFFLTQGTTPTGIHSNPYTRELTRKRKNIPAIVFSKKYLSPTEYLEATQKPMSYEEKLKGFLVILLGIGVVIAMAFLASYFSN